MTKRRIHQEPVPRWTPDEDAILRAHFPHRATAALLPMLPRRQTGGISQRARALGLRKSPAYLASAASGRLQRGETRFRATQFQPGQRPWNKGTHYEAGGRSIATRFQPGTRQGVAAAKYQPIGAERVTKDGYLQRKINDDLPFQRRWKFVHHLVWEAAHGPVPAGHALVFANGDRQDTRLENLRLVPRAQLMQRNTIHNYPAPIPQLVQLKGALVRKINRRQTTHAE